MKESQYGLILGPLTLLVIWLSSVMQWDGVYLDLKFILIVLVLSVVVGLIPYILAEKFSLARICAMLVAVAFTGSVLLVYNLAVYYPSLNLFLILYELFFAFTTPSIMAVLIVLLRHWRIGVK